MRHSARANSSCRQSPSSHFARGGRYMQAGYKLGGELNAWSSTAWHYHAKARWIVLDTNPACGRHCPVTRFRKIPQGSFLLIVYGARHEPPAGSGALRERVDAHLQWQSWGMQATSNFITKRRSDDTGVSATSYAPEDNARETGVNLTRTSPPRLIEPRGSTSSAAASVATRMLWITKRATKARGD